MLSLDEKIGRTQRLLRKLQEDEPLLTIRVAHLGKEQQESSRQFAAEMIALTQAELAKLLEAHALQAEIELAFPAPAD